MQALGGRGLFPPSLDTLASWALGAQPLGLPWGSFSPGHASPFPFKGAIFQAWGTPLAPVDGGEGLSVPDVVSKATESAV